MDILETEVTLSTRNRMKTQKKTKNKKTHNEKLKYEQHRAPP